MKLAILAPDVPLFEGAALSLNIAEPAGSFTILKGHAPFITVIKDFVTTIKTEDGNLRFVAANSGTLKVLDDHITLLVDYGIIATNKEEAQKNLSDLRQAIADDDDATGDDTIANLELELMRRMKELGDL